MVLEDVKIIDLTRLLSGPYATMMLSDLGAEVIKVETKTGDDSRHFGPPFIGDWSTYFISVNRNKRSISLNLKEKKGKEVFLKLIKDADVVVENFKPGTMDRLGLSYEVLKSKNPSIILASISGFGQKGKYSKKPGYDVLAQAMGGLMSVTGEKDGAPQKAGYSFADLGTGMWTAFGIMIALWNRNKTGKGQWIDASLLDTIISWQTYLASSYFATGKNPTPLGTEHPNIVPYQAFEASDGYIIIAIATDAMWNKFVNEIGIVELENSLYKKNSDRVQNREILLPILKNIFIKRTKKEWEEFFSELSIPVGPVNQLSDILNDDYVDERNMVINNYHSELGHVKTLGSPVQYNEIEKSIFTFPPKLGEDGTDILLNLGYTEKEINLMRDQNILHDNN